jgi:tripartite-type tricarboxylate transporter receptor subunit TctC
MRLVAKLASAELHQPTFVENKPGGDTVIGVQALLNAPADGYDVLMLSPSSVVINPVINPALTYNPRDVRPVAGMLRSASLLVTGAGSPYKSFADVVSAARAKPRTVSIANYGHHYRFGALRIQKELGIEFNHVTYKSASQLQTDVIGGSVDLALADIGGVMPLIQAGKLRPLAITSRERLAQLPNVPTLRESGLPDYELYVWIGLGIHAKTPDAVARTLEAALLRAVEQPEFRTYVTQNAMAEVYPIPGKELSAVIAAETERYRQLVKEVDGAQR